MPLSIIQMLNKIDAINKKSVAIRIYLTGGGENLNGLLNIKKTPLSTTYACFKGVRIYRFKFYVKQEVMVISICLDKSSS